MESDSLISLLVFVFWVLVALFGNKKKKKKAESAKKSTLAPTTRARETEPRSVVTHPEREPQPEEEPIGLPTGMPPMLENLLRKLQPPEEGQPAPRRQPTPVQTATVPPLPKAKKMSLFGETMEPEGGRESRNDRRDRTETAIQAASRQKEKTNPASEIHTADGRAGKHPVLKDGVGKRVDLRQMVIWSEILAPPLSIRSSSGGGIVE